MAWPTAADRSDQRIGSHLGADDDLRIRRARLCQTPRALFDGHNRSAGNGLRFRRDIDSDAVLYGLAALSSATTRRATLVASARQHLGTVAFRRQPGLSLLRTAAHIEAAWASPRG